MADVKEKLVELVNDVLQYLPWGEIQKDTAERIADRMMDNGVTIANHDDTNGKLLIHFKPDKTLAELKQDLQNVPVMLAGNDGSIEIIKPYEWISVKDRLPEVATSHNTRWDKSTDSIRVLCACVQADGKKMVKEGYCKVYSDGYVHWKIPGTIHSVTHWQYLPQPPKGE